MRHRSHLRKLGLGSALLGVWACTPAQVQGEGLTALASFNGTDGARPFSSVTIDANGDLYGTANVAGDGIFGTVWELAAGSGTITVLASFNDTTGTFPEAGVTLDANGNLYGTTNAGGASCVPVSPPRRAIGEAP